MKRRYDLFEIVPESEKLAAFRQAYVDTISQPSVYKVVSSSAEWFYFNHGIYDVKTHLKDEYFEFTFIKKGDSYPRLFKNFIEYGPKHGSNIKAIRYNGEEKFLYTDSNVITRGTKYSLEPVIPVSEDIYNLSQIQFRQFSTLELDDLSKYSEFFKVSFTPYASFSEEFIEDLYRTGKINSETYLSLLENLEKEMSLVNTLRRK